MSLPNWLLLTNLVLSCFLSGLIWLVQIVHYPLFSDVGADAFGAYHRKHTRLITYVVAGPMLMEALAVVAMIFYRPIWVPGWIAGTGLILVLIWLSTAFLQVPRHNQLAAAFGDDLRRELVATNWVRTIAWTCRAGLMVYAVGLALR